MARSGRFEYLMIGLVCGMVLGWIIAFWSFGWWVKGG